MYKLLLITLLIEDEPMTGATHDPLPFAIYLNWFYHLCRNLFQEYTHSFSYPHGHRYGLHP